MALDKGIVIVQGAGAPLVGRSLPNTRTTVGVIGTIANTASPTAAGTPVLIQNASDVIKYFGTPVVSNPVNPQENTLLNGISVLQRYGAGRIVAISCGTALNDGAVGAALDMMQKSFSVTGVEPSILIVPRMQPTDAYIDKAIAVCTSLRAIAIVGILPVAPFDTVDKVVAARKGGGGIGKSDNRIVYCYGEILSNQNVIEALSAHIAGIITVEDVSNYGRSPGNKVLSDVKSYNPPIVMSFVDENADTEKFNDEGIMCLNRRDVGFVTWGDRTSAYPKDESILTFINVWRIRDAIARMAQIYARPFIDMESNRRTGELCAIALEAGLASFSSEGAIQQGYSSEFLENESDYSLGKLVIALFFTPYTPLQIVEVRPNIMLTLSVTPTKAVVVDKVPDKKPIMR